MNRPGEFQVPDEVPDEWRHPSGVLFRYGPEVPEDSRLYYRTFQRLCAGELVVDIMRRCADGEFHAVCCVAMSMRPEALVVRAFPEDGMNDVDELTVIPLADILWLEVQ